MAVVSQSFTTKTEFLFASLFFFGCTYWWILQIKKMPQKIVPKGGMVCKFMTSLVTILHDLSKWQNDK